jgi:hypothetical protein
LRHERLVPGLAGGVARPLQQGARLFAPLVHVRRRRVLQLLVGLDDQVEDLLAILGEAIGAVEKEIRP